MAEETVEAKLKAKLEAGEISQEEYDSLMKKFEDLDLMGSKVGGKPRNYSFTGSKVIDGGDISQPVKVSGKLRSTSSMSCPTLIVSGSAHVEGDLSVVETTRVSGSLKVDGQGKFGGPLKLSGSGQVSKSAYFTDQSKVSGRLQVGETLVSDSPVSVSGSVEAVNVTTTSSFKLSGKIMTQESIETQTFISSGGNSSVGGSLKASTVEIAKKWRTKALGDDDQEGSFSGESMNLENLGELGSFVSKMVTEFVPKVISSVMAGGSSTPPKIFVVEQNVEGDVVDLSYTHVKGDIIADKVYIGPEVTVDGTIKYKSEIIMPENATYTVEKADL